MATQTTGSSRRGEVVWIEISGNSGEYVNSEMVAYFSVSPEEHIVTAHLSNGDDIAISTSYASRAEGTDALRELVQQLGLAVMPQPLQSPQS
jgi:hypothetical protein